MAKENKINEDVLCVLTYNIDSKQTDVGYVEVEKDLILCLEFKNLENMFEKDYYNAKSIVQHIINHKKLNILFSNYNYCIYINRPYQGFYSTLEIIQNEYSSNFNTIKDVAERKFLINTEKARLLFECRERLLALSLEKVYKKCDSDKNILAYSHRRVGWSAPKYNLNEHFSFELKTNFGYGSVSYFYSKIRYKELDIIPFSDWVNYKFAHFYEIVQYSAKHYLTNESWLDAIKFISEACNLSLVDENEFIQKYIINQCEEMVCGLKKILNNDSFKIHNYKFFNQEKGYVDLNLEGHNLIEFKGEKISGALQFIETIRQFGQIIEIDNFINGIEECNQKILPQLVKEQEIVQGEIHKLNEEKNIVEPALNSLSLQNTDYEQKKSLLRTINHHDFEKKFMEQHPEYAKFKELFDKLLIGYNIQWFVKFFAVLGLLLNNKKSVYVWVTTPKIIHAMTGTRDSLHANIGDIITIGAIKRRILQTIFPLLFTLPQRHNFKQLARWSGYNEGTMHQWYGRELGLDQFNRSLIDRHGSGDLVTIFDPCFMSKSGKLTPGIDKRWSGQAQAPKRGIEIGSFAVGDVEHHTAFHLHAELTPSGADLKDAGKNLMAHYVDLVGKRASDIRHFGGILAGDGYFGVSTFVNPVVDMGITVISCLKANAALHYAPAEVVGKRPKGRPAGKGAKIKWNDVDEAKLPVVYADQEKRVRSAQVWVKCLHRLVRLVAVEYLKKDGSLQSRKLYFCTDTGKAWDWILERYGIRFQIEFLFRDAKQFLGLAHCQSTNQTKIENHVNLTLTALSVAKVTHWLPLPKEERGPFSMAELKMYYHNLDMVERFSCALGLDPTHTKNNPKIRELLFPISYAKWAA